ncbi:MAG: hypothetical protein L6Q98_01995 [Anaerolineae bacterium]|nr:hypothetical protein [Anaerolineae bacterium]NUQ05869.1 hypothetical protein [Anaerolineae bacterium]
MSQLLEAFGLGTAAILTNACMLPLYPGLLAFLAGNAAEGRARRAMPLFGVLVLAGILTMMLVIGLILFLLQQSFGAALQIVLPAIYAMVIAMGVLLLLDRNPFARLAFGGAPLVGNPYAAAYLYGLLFGPMTLPCTGPIITSAFVLGAGDAGALADGLLYFLAFGLGFGWPLALLPLAAIPLQRRLIGWLTGHHRLLNQASGLLLIAVGVFGILTELVPNYVAGFEIAPEGWAFYWGAAALLIAALAAFSLRGRKAQRSTE